MSKHRVNATVKRRVKSQMDKQDLSFCYEAKFTPGGVEFLQLETPHSVVINLCPEHAGHMLWHFGNSFVELPKSVRDQFDNCVLLFAKRLLAHPDERSLYELNPELVSYLGYLEIDQVSCSPEEQFEMAGDEKSTRH